MDASILVRYRGEGHDLWVPVILYLHCCSSSVLDCFVSQHELPSPPSCLSLMIADGIVTLHEHCAYMYGVLYWAKYSCLQPSDVSI